ncbi:FtsW/RodA/SpoVE family cell cycle protein [Prolixibacter sp. NT017]|uniref:FtsW/RodA/SpoVE family cell cycle protein n=1 Tax=Prolixibacter sp. NT017 TaxID=2652390 RepID=UPI001289EAAE|nr:FtsW/RodA/SpoVE family cell cycle protein [Prolixibacter sp. NT017]GET27584.1 rod shape-determining protein RodA [Prolixibacter sp. NT017]
MGFGVYRKYFKGDNIIWAVLVALSIASMLIIYSSTGALAFRVAGGNTAHYLIRQTLMHLLGFGIILVMVNIIPIKFYNRTANLGMLTAFFFIIMGLVFGRASGGTGRTLPLGFITFQPAELAKVALVIWVSRILANNQTSKESLKKAFGKTLLGAAAICAPIAVADFSTAGLLFTTVVIMMFVGRVPFKYMMLLAMAGVALVAILYFIAPHLPDGGRSGRIKTVRARIERYIHGDKRSEKGLTQADFAKIAIHRGGFGGVGTGNSTVSNFMSAAYNDFVYSIIIEEYGMFGGGVILLFYIMLLTRGGILLKKSNRTFPAFLATGITVLLFMQAMINMGVSVGILPVTGQPLPWISWGGTSQLFTAIAFGLLLSVSSQNNKERREEIEHKFHSTEDLPDEDVQLKEETV